MTPAHRTRAPGSSGDAVEEAMAAIDRRDFLPGHVRGDAGQDAPLAIGHGQTNSQPSTVRAMLGLLEVRPGQRVLDVGAGSGWTTAILGRLVGEQGSVLGVELIPELADAARAANTTQDQPWATVRAADPTVLGAPEQGPFDRILVSAEPASLPRQLVDQLASGGLMVIPVAGVMQRVRRDADGIQVEEHGLFRFVPLVTEGPTDR